MIALIPARGGSKGLPNKNIKELNGKPLIQYTIDAALKAPSIKRVLVSTDSKEIADIAKKLGAETPFLRPSELATDNAKAIDVYNHAITYLENENTEELEEIVILLPTCPLRDYDDIENAIKLYKDRRADSVVSFTKESHPVYWHAWYHDDLKVDFIFDHRNQNRQDLKKSIYPNGAIFIIKSELIKAGTYYNSSSLTYIMTKEKSVDIDTLYDFKLAEFLMNQGNSK